QRYAAQFPQLAFNREAGLQISSSALHEIESRRSGTRVMVLSESTLFVVLVIIGFSFLIRTWKRERFLMLQQSNFLHAVTHELRSPLQSLRLAVETSQRKPERFTRYATDMLADLDRLGSLVDNLLTTGRLEAEAFRAQVEVADLSSAIRSEVERVKRSHQLPGKRLSLQMPASISARFDPSTLEPIVRNLIDNAIKYGGDGTVRISLEQDTAEVVFAVEDDGRGLQSEELARVFDRFWRAGDERIRTAPGTGLGLFLVRELAQAQGARVRVESHGLNQGSRFEVRWPLN
ncbi:MAG: HAMP domain-containing histidine kinase, partial [Planctomycetes bacterium]|nr:HAMP domain-containing histidine kinase [Planctomycetota bacterium]